MTTTHDIATTATTATTYVPPTAVPATTKQIELIKKLAAEREITLKSDYDWTKLSRKGASDVIDGLLAAPEPGIPTDVGVYRLDGKIYRLKPNQSGTKIWAYRFDIVEAGRPATWTYVGHPRVIKGAQRLTLDQAEEFGRIINYCCACGALLTNDKSIDLGIGPVCRKKWF